VAATEAAGARVAAAVIVVVIGAAVVVAVVAVVVVLSSCAHNLWRVNIKAGCKVGTSFEICKNSFPGCGAVTVAVAAV
jgi:hypothetical protein